MTNQKITYVIVITFFLTLISSGLAFGEVYKISEYFPVQTGNKWEYTTGERYFTSETHTNPSGHTGQLYGTDTYEYAMFIKNSGIGLMFVGSYERPENELSDSPNPLILIPETMSIGESHNVTFFTDTFTTTLEARENITVPAGTFETIRYKITVMNDEQESYYTYLWFAKGIGIIKIDRENVYPPNSGCMFVCRPDNNYTLVNTPAELISAEIDGVVYENENKLPIAVMNLLLSGKTPATFKISEYFPIQTGKRWEYTTGERYFTSETHTNPSGHTGQLYGTDTYEYAMFIKNSGTGLMFVGSYKRPENELSDFPNSLILIPEIMSIGESHNVTFFTDTFTTTLEARESIIVPAGTFETIRYKITVVNDEQESYYTYLWFAKGIGIIKIDRENVYPPNSGCMFVCRPDNNYTLVNTSAELTSVNF